MHRRKRALVIKWIFLTIFICAAISIHTIFSPKLTTRTEFGDVEYIEILGTNGKAVLKNKEAEELFILIANCSTWGNFCPESSVEYVGNASDYEINIKYTDDTTDILYVDEARNAAIRQLKQGKQPPIVKAHSMAIIDYIERLSNN